MTFESLCSMIYSSISELLDTTSQKAVILTPPLEYKISHFKTTVKNFKLLDYEHAQNVLTFFYAFILCMAG